MPAIISAEYYDQWLDPDMQDITLVIKIANQASAYADMTIHAGTTKIYRVAFDNKQCIDQLSE